jgi:hypothetical protein
MENGGYWLSVVLSGNWYSTLLTNLLLVKICYRLRFFYVQREWYSSHTRHIYVPSQNRYLLRPIRSADNLLVELHPMAVRCVLFLYQGCLTRTKGFFFTYPALNIFQVAVKKGNVPVVSYLSHFCCAFKSFHLSWICMK